MGLAETDLWVREKTRALETTSKYNLRPSEASSIYLSLKFLRIPCEISFVQIYPVQTVSSETSSNPHDAADCP